MSGPWHVLIQEVPASPHYLRLKVRNRLARLGAVALKDSVYFLPARDELLPRLREVAQEVRQGSGAAHILQAEFVEPCEHEALVASFNEKREADYKALAHEADALLARIQRRSTTRVGALRARVTIARRRLAAIDSIDFFGAPSRAEAAARVSALEDALAPRQQQPPTLNKKLLGRTWVTRRGIQVDRIASAWFIRRFIDPAGRLRFMDPANPDLRPGEITYDMVGADFTHEEDRCSFETLIFRTGARDPALARVAEIVHEIDIKDAKYSSPETKGVQQMLAGMLVTNPSDQERLDRGFAMFDDLYQSFRHRLPPTGARRPPQESDPNEGRLS